MQRVETETNGAVAPAAAPSRFEPREMAMFKTHREAFLRQMAPGSVAIFRSAPEVRYHSTNAASYRQDPDFYYLTGFEEPDAIAVLTPASKMPYTLFVRPRDKAREIWDGKRAGPEGARAEFGADAAHTVDEFEEQMEKPLKNVGRVYWALGSQDEEFERRLLKLLRRFTYDRSRHPTPLVEVADPRPILHEQRLIKDAAELELLRRACAITALAHVETIKATSLGMKEYELQAVAEYYFRRSGAGRVSYLSIVGAGPNATILHYGTNRAAILDGDLVLMDAGAEYQMYAADITRTWPANGRFTPPQRAIYDVVLEAQQAALAEIRPGATFMAIHNAALRRITERLTELGVVKGDVEESLREKRFQPFFMHGTGHWLGLDVHDCGRYKTGEESRVLQPGMVFTVEPGVYVAEDAEDVDPQYKGIGVRIEDDVLVTKTGYEVLTIAAAKEPDEIERLMAAAVADHKGNGR